MIELTQQTISTSEPEKPSRRQKACKGAVRKMVKRLPVGWREVSTAATGGDKELGDRSNAAGSPFSAPFIPCTCLQPKLLLIWF